MDLNFKSQLEERLKEGRAADRIDKARAEGFRSMMATDGWKLYVELLNARKQLFADALMTPAGGVDGAVALEFVKGTMSGLILASDLPSIIIAVIDSPAGPATDGEDEDA